MEKKKDEWKPDENKMRTRPAGRLLFTMALPLILSMLVQAVYNVVDSVYVSQISESAVTALSLAFPVQNLLIGCAIGVAVGVNSLLSKSLGEGNRDHANIAAGNGIFLAAIVMVVFMVFGIVGSRPYYTIQSTVAETIEGGTSYVYICCLFCGGLLIEVLGERLLQATGRTVYTLFTQGTGAILNIILDPVFIFGFEPLGIAPMGVAGAAVATVIGQWVAGIMAVIFNLKCNKEVQFGLKYLRPHGKVMKLILAVGIPSMVMMAIGSVMNFAMNQILLGFKQYGETPAAVFGVYFKLQSFVFMPVFGLNNAAITLVAYNYGARLPQRITKVLKASVTGAFVFMVAGTLLFQFAPNLLLMPFDPSADFMDMGMTALRIISFHFPLAAIGIALSASFQGLGNGSYSTIISLCRQLIVLVPVTYLLSLSGNIHLVWWAFLISEVVSLALTLAFFRRIYKARIKPLYT